MALSPKQARFVAEYLIDSNGTQAAIRAGYAAVSAKVTASRLLTNANVRAALNAGAAKIAAKLEITAESLIRDVMEIGDEARQAASFAAALRSRELIARSLKDDNPFSETTVTKVELGDDTLAGQELLRTLAFLLASGSAAIAAPAAPPQATKH